MWQSYSAKSAAALIGVPESTVRSLVRAGLVGSSIEPPIRLSFRDLSGLRAIKGLLDRGMSLTRLRNELIALRARLGDEVALTELPLEVRGGRVVVRGEQIASGQLELPWARADVAPVAAADVVALPTRTPSLVHHDYVAPSTADEWFERALALEQADTQAAMDAYQRVLRLRPEASEAWINLGRLHAEQGEANAATQCFTQALEVDPRDATALYNLGVVAQDRGHDTEAIALYERALGLDGQLAEAHYNLATLFDQAGNTQQAIRHLNEYRKLTKC